MATFNIANLYTLGYLTSATFGEPDNTRNTVSFTLTGPGWGYEAVKEALAGDTYMCAVQMAHIVPNEHSNFTYTIFGFFPVPGIEPEIVTPDQWTVNASAPKVVTPDQWTVNKR